MKPQMLVDELVDLGVYSVEHDKVYESNEGFMTTIDLNERVRRVDDNGLTNDDIKLILSTKQTSYLRSIKWIATFYATLTTIGLVFGFIFIILPLMS